MWGVSGAVLIPIISMYNSPIRGNNTNEGYGSCSKQAWKFLLRYPSSIRGNGHRYTLPHYHIKKCVERLRISKKSSNFARFLYTRK